MSNEYKYHTRHKNSQDTFKTISIMSIKNAYTNKYFVKMSSLQLLIFGCQRKNKS